MGDLMSVTIDGTTGISKVAPLGAKASELNFDTSLFAFRNKIINGGFDIWQRGTSQTSDNMGSDDRWYNINSITTKVHSQQSFALGQIEVPGNPRYYSRTVVSSVANAASLCAKFQSIEGVKTLSGSVATLSFYAKADSTKKLAIYARQYFGTGGSPSSPVDGIGYTLLNLTSSWQKFTINITLPSISGKTLGTDNNNSLQLYFWFDTGSNYNGLVVGLGQQSGTFDIAQVQLEEGSVATPFEQRPYGTEFALCQRYFEVSIGIVGGYDLTGSYLQVPVIYQVQKRTQPTLTLGDAYKGAVNINNLSSVLSTQVGFVYQGSVISAGHGEAGHYILSDAEL